MKTLDELKRFYHQALKPDLQVLEKQRLAIVKKITIIGVAAFTVAGGIILFHVMAWKKQGRMLK